MANVLPQESKQKILRTQYARLICAFAVAALCVALISLVALAASYLMLVFGLKRVETSGQSLSTSTPQAAALEESKRFMSALDESVKATTTKSELLDAVLAVKPLGIRIQSMSFAGGEDGTIVLSGVATRASDIESYRLSLAGDSRFDSVSVPVGALFSESGAFTITLRGAF